MWARQCMLKLIKGFTWNGGSMVATKLALILYLRYYIACQGLEVTREGETL